MRIVQIRTVMKIEIEKTNDSPFIVKSGGKTSEPLGWEEMLGLIAALTIPDKKPCVHWMHEEIRGVPFEEIPDNPFEEEVCNSILLSIGGNYPNWTFLDDKRLELRGVLNTCQYKNKFIPDYIFYDGKIIDTSKSAPEEQSWIEWIQSIIETLNESDRLLIYEVYD
jgi:hypothetical protein